MEKVRAVMETVPLSAFRRLQDDPRYSENGHYFGPGIHIPPRREDCSCACSALDDIGRPLHIGWCPDTNCERRPG